MFFYYTIITCEALGSFISYDLSLVNCHSLFLTVLFWEQKYSTADADTDSDTDVFIVLA